MATKFLVVTHKVKDYAQWKKVFDESETLRHEYGVRGGWILRDQKEKNLITVAVEVEDLAAAKEMMNSAQLQEMIQRSGVIDLPEIRFLEELDKVPELTSAARGKQSNM